MIDKSGLRDYALASYRYTGVLNDETFKADFFLFVTVKKMISRFLNSGQVNERRLINNVLISLNTFGGTTCNVIYRSMLDDSQYGVVKAILIFLRQYNKAVGEDVKPDRIMTDILRDIKNRYGIQ